MYDPKLNQPIMFDAHTGYTCSWHFIGEVTLLVYGAADNFPPSFGFFKPTWIGFSSPYLTAWVFPGIILWSFPPTSKTAPPSLSSLQWVLC